LDVAAFEEILHPMFDAVRQTLRGQRRRRRERRQARVRIGVLEPLLAKGAVGAELGVFEGTFTKQLVERLRPQKLHLMDPWFRLSGEWDWAKGKPSTVEAVRHLLKIYKPQLAERSIEIHIDFDTEVLPRFDDHYFDWVYLDSSHQYEQTVRELQILSRKVKPAGVIAGDDWWTAPDHIHHGVCRAVREFVEATDYEFLLADETTVQWAIGRRS